MKVLGVCNGFQILFEAGLLPGALMRNASLKFVCREVKLEVENADTRLHPHLRARARSSAARSPIATATTSPTTRRWRARRRRPGRVPLCRGHQSQRLDQRHRRHLNERGNVLGMMPHPENLIEPAHGGTDGRALFESALGLAA